MKIIKWIKSLFATPSYQESVDKFIASKQPKTIAEVDYWVNYFMQHRFGA
jgi:hypothetical protein